MDLAVALKKFTDPIEVTLLMSSMLILPACVSYLKFLANIQYLSFQLLTNCCKILESHTLKSSLSLSHRPSSTESVLTLAPRFLFYS